MSEFVRSKEPVQMLTDLSALDFTDRCSAYLDHPKTTEELKTCFADLRVLGKIDFKKILKWRMLMRDQGPKKSVSNEDSDGDSFQTTFFFVYNELAQAGGVRKALGPEGSRTAPAF